MRSKASNTVLLVGGAGYIGAHAAKRLARAGYEPVVYDDLSTGHADFVRWGPLEEGGLTDARRLTDVLIRHAPSAVMHFAARASVEESVNDPAAYYRNNVAGTLCLLDAMRITRVDRLVFSSTCALYASSHGAAITEDMPLDPASPYGHSKLMCERMLQDYGAAYGLRSVSLRYFNAAGADADGELGERREIESHLIPLALEVAAGRRAKLSIFGTDYPTPDGTCIRDYVHVDDLAEAHLAALNHLEDGGRSLALNLGTEVGYGVLEIVAAAEQVTGRKIPVEHLGRRPGDWPRLVADSGLARAVLGWEPKASSLWNILESAWRWKCSQGERAVNGLKHEDRSPRR